MNEIFKPRNVAAWQLKEGDRTLTVSKADYTSPPDDHVVIKVVDIAINPIDWILQSDPPEQFDVKYPAIFGRDVAGEIVEVGDGVDDFRPGQRVIANVGSSDDPSKGGFQKYAVVPKAAVAELPYAISTANGVVLPLGISTAAAGLFQKDYLNLPKPKVIDPKAKTREDLPDRTVLIWGGSSSVGTCAIQLAAAAGVEVITTASPSNFEYCKKLGAAQTFDYHDDDVEKQIIDALKGKTLVGAFHAVGADGAVQACARIVDYAKGKAIVVSVRGIPDDGIPSSVRTKAISAANIFTNDIGPYIWRDFLPTALDKGTIVPLPEPLFVGEELRSVQAGLDRQKKGVSAQKVVVTNIS